MGKAWDLMKGYLFAALFVVIATFVGMYFYRGAQLEREQLKVEQLEQKAVHDKAVHSVEIFETKQQERFKRVKERRYEKEINSSSGKHTLRL